MYIRTPADLGALIRDRRKKLRLDQKTLANKVGVSRQWIVEVEKGKSRAEIGLLLRTIRALGIDITSDKETWSVPDAQNLTVDIDAIVAAARRKRP